MSRLRDAPTDFFALIGTATDHFGLADPAFVEKDYWVVELLRSIAAPLPLVPLNGQASEAHVVFKGGTSLSKAFGIIERFSEDVDVLVVCSYNLGAAARENRVLRPLCDRASEDLGLDAEAVERGKYRTGLTRTATYRYPARYRPTVLREGVLLEMGIRGGTQPGLVPAQVRSFIAAYLEAIEAGAPFEECAVVEVDVLHPARTLVEKLALLHHAATAATAGDTVGLERAGRHYYDVHRLLADQAVIAVLEQDEIRELAADVDAKSQQYRWACTPRPEGGYATSVAFQLEGPVAPVVRTAYQAIGPLVYGDLPNVEECIGTVVAAGSML